MRAHASYERLRQDSLPETETRDGVAVVSDDCGWEGTLAVLLLLLLPSCAQRVTQAEDAPPLMGSSATG
jgi:hypothetical protein